MTKAERPKFRMIRLFHIFASNSLFNNSKKLMCISCSWLHLNLRRIIEVVGNPKTILNKSKCSKAIQSSIYKYDQVITFLKGHQEDKTIEKGNLETNMYKISDFLIENNKPLKMDYLAKYGLSNEEFIVEEKARTNSIKEVAAAYSDTAEVVKAIKTTEIKKAVNNAPIRNSENMVGDLKKYRMKVSKEEGIKPYYVFLDKELEELIRIMPRSRKELLQVKGFTEKRVAKYGDEIIRILKG